MSMEGKHGCSKVWNNVNLIKCIKYRILYIIYNLGNKLDCCKHNVNIANYTAKNIFQCFIQYFKDLINDFLKKVQSDCLALVRRLLGC